MTYRQSIRTAQLLLQTTLIGFRGTRPVGIVETHNSTERQEGRNKYTEVEETLAGGDVGVLLRAEHSQEFVLLVDRLPEVPPLLRIPPSAVWISELALHSRGVLVAAILLSN